MSRFSTLASATILVLLGACSQQETSKSAESSAAAPTGASLWRVVATDDGAQGRPMQICADAAVQQAFTRPSPKVGDEACRPVREPSTQADFYAVRCQFQGKLYSAESRSTGDLSRDFSVETVIKGEDPGGPTFRQVRRYVRIGDCPAGWRVGDSASPGDSQVVNATSGEVRQLGQPLK